MSRVAPVVPADDDILCEGCGYTLNGLPESGNCPECGTPIASSTFEDRREPPAWEQPQFSLVRRFTRTTADVLVRPTRFFRTLPTRVASPAAKRFAVIHWWIAGALFALAAMGHAAWYWFDVLLRRGTTVPWQPVAAVLLFIGTYFALDGLTRLASKLTAWEAAYRGIRLPYAAVLRAMHYHAAHYTPVALVAFVTVFGYQLLLRLGVVGPFSATFYLYLLSAEVILGALYLFQTYWIGMRNMMYANR